MHRERCGVQKSSSAPKTALPPAFCVVAMNIILCQQLRLSLQVLHNCWNARARSPPFPSSTSARVQRQLLSRHRRAQRGMRRSCSRPVTQLTLPGRQPGSTQQTIACGMLRSAVSKGCKRRFASVPTHVPSIRIPHARAHRPPRPTAPGEADTRLSLKTHLDGRGHERNPPALATTSTT